MLNDAFTWFMTVVRGLVSGLNFAITFQGYSFGLLDFLVASALLGIVVRNFVHTAR